MLRLWTKRIWQRGLVAFAGRASLVRIAALLVVLTPAAWHLCTLVTTLCVRLAFPMDFEWMESSHVYHAYRLLHHLPLYIDPARGFATFPYPPLYWVVVAVLGKVFGLDYSVARGVSVASIGVTAFVCGTQLVRHAPTRWIGVAFAIIAAASIGAGYPFAYGSFDLARPDAFATAVAVLATAIVGEGTTLSTRRILATSILLISTLYAKQTGVFFVVWILIFVCFRSRRHGILLGAATFLGSSTLLAILCVNTGGWFWLWLFDMRHHAMSPLHTLFDPLKEFLQHAPFLVLLPGLTYFLHRRKSLRAETTKWIGTLGAALTGALVAHAKEGGWVNLYTPVLFLAWPVSLLVVCDLLRAMQKRAPSNAPTSKITVMTWATLGAANVLLLLLTYDAQPFRPTEKMWRASTRFYELVASLDGEGVVTTMPFAAARDGKAKPPCTQPILQGYIDAANAGMDVSFVRSLEVSGAHWVIVTGTTFEAHLPEELSRSFELDRQLDVDIDSPGVLHPLPKTLWRRRSP